MYCSRVNRWLTNEKMAALNRTNKKELIGYPLTSPRPRTFVQAELRTKLSTALLSTALLSRCWVPMSADYTQTMRIKSSTSPQISDRHLRSWRNQYQPDQNNLFLICFQHIVLQAQSYYFKIFQNVYCHFQRANDKS